MPTSNAHCRRLRAHRVDLLKGRAHAILIQRSYILLPWGGATVDVCPLCEGIADRHGGLQSTEGVRVE